MITLSARFDFTEVPIDLINCVDVDILDKKVLNDELFVKEGFLLQSGFIDSSVHLFFLKSSHSMPVSAAKIAFVESIIFELDLILCNIK